MDQPQFTMPLKNQTVRVGQNATFLCHVTNIQNNRVSWNYQDVNIRIEIKAFSMLDYSETSIS